MVSCRCRNRRGLSGLGVLRDGCVLHWRFVSTRPGWAGGGHFFHHFLEQGFGAGHQVLTDLVGAPALPALEFAGGGQHALGMVLEFFVQPATLLTQCLPHGRGSASTGLAVALGELLLEHDQHGLDRRLRLGTLGRVNARFGRSRSDRGAGAGGTQLIGPGRDCRQIEGRVTRRPDGMRQCRIKRLPDRRELLAAGLQHGWKAGIHARPVGVAGEGQAIGLQALQIGGQGVALALGLLPGLGGQHFDALSHHHAGLSLNLGAVLQVLDALDAFGQLVFQGGQGLTGQWRTGLGGVTLPGHGVSQVDPGGIAQGFAFVGPFESQGILGFCTAQFFELFAQRLGGTLVTGTHLTEHLLHGLDRGIGGQPLTQAGGTLAGGGGGKGATSQRVKFLGIVLRGGGRGHVNGLKGKSHKEPDPDQCGAGQPEETCIVAAGRHPRQPWHHGTRTPACIGRPASWDSSGFELGLGGAWAGLGRGLPSRAWAALTRAFQVNPEGLGSSILPIFKFFCIIFWAYCSQATAPQTLK